MTNYAKLLVNIRLPELSGLCNRLSAYYGSLDLSQHADYNTFASQFISLSQSLSLAYNRNYIKSSLASLDAQRADAFRAIYYLLQGYLHQQGNAHKESATVLMKCFAKYGLETLAMSYDGKTGYIESFLGDLGTESMAQAIVLLPGMVDAISGLEEAQNLFTSKQTEYEQTVASEKRNFSTATVLKSELLVLLNRHIVNYHIAVAHLKDEAFQEMALTINKMIVDENALTKARMSAP